MTRAALALILAALAGPAVGRDHPTTAAAAGPSCIDLDQLVSALPAGPNTIEFTMAGKHVYRNTLAAPCQRLEELGRFRQIVWDNRDGRRVCNGDRFRLIETTQARAGGVSSFPFCRLGPFERVTR